jgi:hypothetical protein
MQIARKQGVPVVSPEWVTSLWETMATATRYCIARIGSPQAYFLTECSSMHIRRVAAGLYFITGLTCHHTSAKSAAEYASLLGDAAARHGAGMAHQRAKPLPLLAGAFVKGTLPGDGLNSLGLSLDSTRLQHVASREGHGQMW